MINPREILGELPIPQQAQTSIGSPRWRPLMLLRPTGHGLGAEIALLPGLLTREEARAKYWILSLWTRRRNSTREIPHCRVRAALEIQSLSLIRQALAWK